MKQGSCNSQLTCLTHDLRKHLDTFSDPVTASKSAIDKYIRNFPQFLNKFLTVCIRIARVQEVPEVG